MDFGPARERGCRGWGGVVNGNMVLLGGKQVLQYPANHDAQ